MMQTTIQEGMDPDDEGRNVCNYGTRVSHTAARPTQECLHLGKSLHRCFVDFQSFKAPPHARVVSCGIQKIFMNSDWTLP